MHLAYIPKLVGRNLLEGSWKFQKDDGVMQAGSSENGESWMSSRKKSGKKAMT